MMRILLGSTLASILALATSLAAADALKPLFNERDLSDFVQRGGKATYLVDGGMIVGTSVLNTENTFLCTKKTYGDFILEYQFKVDPRLNSGVQIRSECFDAEKTIEHQGKPKKIPAKRVHGYQIEIDPDPVKARWWSAGIYDEARRGWLYPGLLGGDQKAFTAQGAKLFRQNDWNQVRVEAIGSSIKTWLNGTPCASIIDNMTPRGFIALQVHGIGKDASKNGTKVAWRNLRIQEVSAAHNTLTTAEKAAGWELLFDGTSTSAWRSHKSDAFPSSGWEVKDGTLSVIAGTGAESARGGDIVTRRTYKDFELLVDFKLTPKANSGIKYYVQSSFQTAKGAKAKTGSAIGHEYQVLDDALHPDAKLGRDGNRTIASLYDLLPADKAKQPNPIGEWNTGRILVKGTKVEHWLNGKLVLAYDRDSAEFKDAVAKSKFKSVPGFGAWSEGHILLQDHGDRVFYRNIKIREIK